MIDLWILQPNRFMDIALAEGCRKFTWHVAATAKVKREILSWARVQAMGYSNVRVMFIDHAGAPEYSTFSSYTKPLAVYPTWSSDEDLNQLKWLIKNPVGQIKKFCEDKSVQPDLRPVFGQKHRIVVHQIPPGGPGRQEFMLMLRQIQMDNPEVELFISGERRFNSMFGLGFKAVDYTPHAMSPDNVARKAIALPSGRELVGDDIFDPRYADWFELVCWNQEDMIESENRIRYCINAAQWGSRNFESVKPFVARRNGKQGANTVFMPNEFMVVSNADFVLPAARRKVMRNLGIKTDELDRFTCDTCILQNACSLSRKGAVCTVKGSETVALADSFGSRDAGVIMDGLTQLLKRQAERLEDAMAAEDASGELDPEVTKLAGKVFDQGVKLAKLRDPSLSGAKVQVNVGVGAGGQAAVSVGGSDPKQLMASVVAELESAGIPRAEITSDMVKGVLRNMANVPQQQAITAAKVNHEVKQAKAIGKTSVSPQATVIEGESS